MGRRSQGTSGQTVLFGAGRSDLEEGRPAREQGLRRGGFHFDFRGRWRICAQVQVTFRVLSELLSACQFTFLSNICLCFSLLEAQTCLGIFLPLWRPSKCPWELHVLNRCLLLGPVHSFVLQQLKKKPKNNKKKPCFSVSGLIKRRFYELLPHVNNNQ